VGKTRFDGTHLSDTAQKSHVSDDFHFAAQQTRGVGPGFHTPAHETRAAGPDLHTTAQQTRDGGPDLALIFEPIREDLEAVEREFIEHIQSRVALIPEMGRYIQKSGGKRVRPAVLLMASRLSGYRGDRAVLYASVVEFIHTATLVHDDIIDGADLRRGRLAVHSRWGNDITVLLGDYLYIKSMAMALTQDSLEVIRLLCDVTLRMIEGELYQLTKTGDVDITEEEHFEIIRRKTAFLFGGCAQIGGKLGAVTREHEDALREFGFNLGIAFQIVDDLLDYTADAVALGKPIGGDLREGKVTLPVIFLLRRGGDEADRLIREVVRDRAVTGEQWREILHLLREHRSTELAYARALEFANRAKSCLSVFPASRERDALLALTDYVVSRDR
jgi:octaprenyl-diphosphate synthase